MCNFAFAKRSPPANAVATPSGRRRKSCWPNHKGEEEEEEDFRIYGSRILRFEIGTILCSRVGKAVAEPVGRASRVLIGRRPLGVRGEHKCREFGGIGNSSRARVPTPFVVWQSAPLATKTHLQVDIHRSTSFSLLSVVGSGSMSTNGVHGDSAKSETKMPAEVLESEAPLPSGESSLVKSSLLFQFSLERVKLLRSWQIT